MGKQNKKLRILTICIVIFFAAIFVVGISFAKGKKGSFGFSNISGTLGQSKQYRGIDYSLFSKKLPAVAFTVHELDKAAIKRMMNKSYKPNKDIKVKDLRLVKVAYLGFDNEIHEGELVVNEKVSMEVADIFQELYEAKFQIEKITLIDQYEAEDEKSMEENNTSCFNYRKITGGKSLSNHALGLAIDINPARNPYVFGKQILPKNSVDYLDRKNLRTGMITREGVCYKIFKKHGWSWGGDWGKPIDYQHFEKKD